jgi:TRAP-type C4-dicarboxylate transport system permease small subunit
MSRVLEKVDRFCDDFERIGSWGGRLSAFFLFAAVCMITFAVFVRYVFGEALPWSVEMGGFFLVLIVWFGMANSFKSGEIPRMLLFYRRFSPKTQAIVDSATLALSLVFLLLLFRSSIDLVGSLQRSKVASAIMQLPRWWLAVCVTAGIFMLIVQVAISIYRILRSLGSSQGK